MTKNHKSGTWGAVAAAVRQSLYARWQAGESIHSLSREIGIKAVTLERRLRDVGYATDTGRPQDRGTGESQHMEGNDWIINNGKTPLNDLDSVLAYYKVDLGLWAVERFVVNKWDMGLRDKSADLAFDEGKVSGKLHDTGRVHVQPLFQIKIWLKRKVVQASVREELASMLADAKLSAPKFKQVKHSAHKSGKLLELSIPDLHLGKLAWGVETGWTDYDVRIAERTFDAAVQALLERTSVYKFEQVCFVVGNDLLQTDNVAGTTTAGTPVSSDSRYHKTFRIGRLMITRAIEQLRLLAPVWVVVVPGNHDQLSAWHLGESLECYFHKCPDVVVANDPTPRKYLQWGKVMLMFTHKGQKARLADYPLLMATEQPVMFGVTAYREVHTGDQHQVRLEEKHGIRVRILPSLSAPDDWHSAMGFVSNIRQAECFVWDKVEGLIGTAVYSVPG